MSFLSRKKIVSWGSCCVRGLLSADTFRCCSRVIWFNLGNHHVPRSGDLPNTLQHTSASSVWFMPYNFHDRDPSRQTSQGIRVGGPKTYYEALVPEHDLGSSR